MLVERSYQAPFCQMLAADGHLVVHSTRHAAIEFGKDIITIGRDGVPCAFQLKGNPGSRLILRQLRDIRPQLLEQQERFRNRGEYVEGLRDSWEKLANRHLERNGYDARIDRRSLQDRGIEREPEQHRGPTVTKMERERGEVTHIGDEIRRRQQHYAELRSLQAEERQIDAEIIDLEARRAQRQAQEAAQGRVDDVRSPDSSADRSRDFSFQKTAREFRG